MAETKKGAGAQEPSTPAAKKAAAVNKAAAAKKAAAVNKAAADKKAAAASPESETKPVADLLASILSDVQQQVHSKAALVAPPAAAEPLQGKALEAAEQFKTIVAALALGPTVTLTAVPAEIPSTNTQFTLIWSSTVAQTVEIFRDDGGPGIGVVLPATGGSLSVAGIFDEEAIFTAVATSLCGTAQARARVTTTGTIL